MQTQIVQNGLKRILALTDSVTTCDCCGRENLKNTYAVTDDMGGEFYYGTTCVKRNLGYTKEEIQRDLNKTINMAQNEYEFEKKSITIQNLNMIEEKKEYKKLRQQIADKYKLPIYSV